MSQRSQAVAMVAEQGDPIRRFGITREEVVEAAAEALVDRMVQETVGSIRGRVYMTVGEAARSLRITRDEVKRRTAYIDNGNRNQILSLAEFDRLVESRTKKPKSKSKQ